MYEEFKQINAQSYYVNLRSGFLYNGVFPILILIANAGTTIVIYFGGLSVLVIQSQQAIGFSLYRVSGLLWFPLTSIASFWSQFQLGLAASERVFALLDAEPRVNQTDQRPVPLLDGKIEFPTCFFSYDQRQTVLADFNLTIRAGETSRSWAIRVLASQAWAN